ncbi:MAG: RnfH family protein [Chromatiaceae bacterium]|nr:RnfH family protein [Chromatiaceae bacterium]
MADYLQVSVAYVGEQGQFLKPLEVAAGTQVRAAIEQSGVLGRFPEIDLGVNKVGIFGKLAKLDQELENGDRVEIYRALIADPRAARKQRAAT